MFPFTFWVPLFDPQTREPTKVPYLGVLLREFESFAYS